MSNPKKIKENGSVTIADLIVMVALAVFAVFSYVGLAIENSISFTVMYVLLYLTVVFACIYALGRIKKVKNDFGKWKIVEFSLLAVYIVVFIFICKPMSLAISATVNNEKLAASGKSDTQKVRSIFEEYDKFEKDAIAKTVNSLKNIDAGARLTTAAKDLVDNTKGPDSTLKYQTKLEEKYLDENENDYAFFKQSITSILEKWDNDLDSWNLMRISAIAREMSGMRDTVSTRLTKFSYQLQPETNRPFKYLLKYNNDGLLDYDSDGTEKLKKIYVSSEPALVFKTDLTKAHSLTGIIVSIIIAFLLLTSYLATPRSTTVEIKERSKNTILDGGISLFD